MLQKGVKSKPIWHWIKILKVFFVKKLNSFKCVGFKLRPADCWLAAWENDTFEIILTLIFNNLLSCEKYFICKFCQFKSHPEIICVNTGHNWKIFFLSNYSATPLAVYINLWVLFYGFVMFRDYHIYSVFKNNIWPRDDYIIEIVD